MAQVVWEGDRADGQLPLVTYRLQCYQHEAFVREAVNSVLAQTYRPLEIVITDDASSDRSFDIIREIIGEYVGPHRIVLHRSERNRDTIGSVNETLDLIRGEFFLWISGDDVAEPNQTERLVSAWLEGGVSGVWSNSRIIDEHGRDLGLQLPADHPYTLNLKDYANGRFLDFTYSGTCGYHRSVIDHFGPLPSHLGSKGKEHHFGFRAALLGQQRHLPEALTRKRRHLGQATAGENLRDRQSDPMVVHARMIRQRLGVLIGCRDTIATPSGIVRKPSHAALADALSLQIVNETLRLREIEARLKSRKASTLATADWRYPPNSLSFVRELPEHECNLLAAECKLFVVPWSVGPVEPCGLRNHAYPGVLSAWSETELVAELSSRSHK
jgi:hypothetical protein